MSPWGRWRKAIGAATAGALILAPSHALPYGLQAPPPSSQLGVIRNLAPSPGRDSLKADAQLERPPSAIRLAYAPAAGAVSTENPAVPRPPPKQAENVVRAALADYAAGALHDGDVLASQVADPVASTALAWQALHAPADVGFDRYASFLSAHPRWPGAAWSARAAEDALWRDKRRPDLVDKFFAHRAPQTAMGALALARARLAEGRRDEAAALVRQVWRQDDLFPALESVLRDQFGAFLTAADDKFRADRLLYKGEIAAALRAAGHAGADELALARAQAAAFEGRASPAVMRSVPAALRQDPSYLFVEILRLHSLDKARDAARLVLAAPRDPAALVDADVWWLQRRWIARELLDLGDFQTAYQLCDGYIPGSRESALDAEFHAGWIALRFLVNPKLAQVHFAKLAELATTPVSKARALYWLARTVAALGSADIARVDFQAAAAFPTTYYGQLAQKEVGVDPPPAPLPTPATGVARDEAVRVVELLEEFGHEDAALSLAIQAAHALDDPAQLEALAAIGERLGDARETLAVGKIAERRGYALQDAAFPTFGIPPYPSLGHAAPAAMVYSVARQESAFRADALSRAGAKGIMQMIMSTARRTAELFRIPFDARRLKTDPAYNAELGAAHLGLLLQEQRGSLILTFAAYNAGGRRVKEWIDKYGDPRRRGVDPVDWVERIPIAETRDYVQRVMENYGVYQARFAAQSEAPVSAKSAAAPPKPLMSPKSIVDPPAATTQARS